MKKLLMFTLFALTAFAQAAEPIHTDAVAVGDWEKFIIRDRGSWHLKKEWNLHVKEITIETKRGFYLTAVEGGGQTCDVVHTDRHINSGYADWERFYLAELDNGEVAILTLDGFFLTAVGGGNRTCRVLYTTYNAVFYQPGYAERFRLGTVREGYGPIYSEYTTIIAPSGNYLTAFRGGEQGRYGNCWFCP